MFWQTRKEIIIDYNTIPLWRSARARWDPKNPAPPVISTDGPILEITLCGQDYHFWFFWLFNGED